jgi:putative intracellular protease/amidase
MVEPKAVLMVVTSHDRIDQNHPTGLWFEEFAVPYRRFREQGYPVEVASPKGGPAPIDPQSMPEDKDVQTNREALQILQHTKPLKDVKVPGFDAVFFPGGHGTMYDMPHQPEIQAIVSHFASKGKVVAAVCHGPAALVGAVLPDGTPVVKGRKVTGFTNEEEAEVKLDQLMPFLLETKLGELGAHVETRPMWKDHVVVDGTWVTGQNP